MPEEDVTKQPEPTGEGEGSAPSQPDLSADLQAAQAKLAEQEKALAQAKLDAETRIGGLEKAVEYVFASRPQPTAQPQVTAEDFAEDPTAAMDRKIQAALASRDQQHAAELNAIKQHSFRGELEGMKNRKYWAEVEGKVSEYFRIHPEEQYPGRADEVYKHYVGEASDAPEFGRDTHRSQPPPTPAPAGGTRPASTAIDTSDPKPVAEYKDGDEAYVSARMNEMGVEMNPEEWEKWQSPRHGGKFTGEVENG